MPIKIKTISFFVFVLLFTFIANTNFIFAQDDDEEEVHSSLRYLRDTYIEYYEADFNNVFESVKQFIIETGAEIDRDVTASNDLGLQKGMIRSKVLVLSQKTDSTFRIIRTYAHKPPFIRGGVWTSVRIQYRILLNDEGDGRISVLFENEFSGFEDNVTFKVHFFKTNGFLEHEGFEKIKNLIEARR